MTTSPAPFIVGPYWDYTQLLRFMREKYQAAAVNCTRAFMAGDIEAARWHSEEFLVWSVKKDALNLRYDLMKNSPDRWIGYDVQHGYES